MSFEVAVWLVQPHDHLFPGYVNVSQAAKTVITSWAELKGRKISL